MNEQLSNEIILQSAALRGEGLFDDAIAIIEGNIAQISPELKLNAWLEAFYTAKEKGDVNLCRLYAKKVADEDPDVPSIQPYL